MSDNNRKCSVCFKTFKTLYLYNSHVNRDYPKCGDPLICKYCPHMATTSSNLQSHMRSCRKKVTTPVAPVITTPKKNLVKYQCHYCFNNDIIKIYKSQSSLNQHFNKHHNTHTQIRNNTDNYEKIYKPRTQHHQQTHSVTTNNNHGVINNNINNGVINNNINNINVNTIQHNSENYNYDLINSELMAGYIKNKTINRRELISNIIRHIFNNPDALEHQNIKYGLNSNIVTFQSVDGIPSWVLQDDTDHAITELVRHALHLASVSGGQQINDANDQDEYKARCMKMNMTPDNYNDKICYAKQLPVFDGEYYSRENGRQIDY
jgi:hypothetical protein